VALVSAGDFFHDKKLDALAFSVQQLIAYKLVPTSNIWGSSSRPAEQVEELIRKWGNPVIVLGGVR
jgi:hypothetical protein